MSYPEKVVELVKENKMEEAVQLLIKAVENEPDEPVHYVNLGSLLFQHKQVDEAESFFLQALQLNEKVATAHYGLATIHYERGEYKKAATALRTCLALEMEDPDVYYLLGLSYLKLKNPLLASPFLQRATELSERIEYLFQYGLTLAKLEHFSEAKSIFKRVLEKNENHTDTLYNLAIIYVHENEIEKAFALLKKTVDLDPQHRLALQALEQFKKDDAE